MKKLLIGLLASIGLFVAAYGCHDMARDMEPGAVLYSRKCASCHNLIELGRFDKETWRRYIEKYGQKLTIEEKQRLVYYLAGSGQKQP